MVERLGLVGEVRPSVALATCALTPDLDEDTRMLLAPLADLGVDAEPRVWDESSIDWSRFNLTIVRSCCDHDEKRSDFLAWAASVGEVANPAEVLRWNADRRYLAELAENGCPVVPTTWLAPGESWYLPGQGIWVVKPAEGMAALSSGLYDASRPGHRAKMAAHMSRLLRADHHVMVQPYLPAVESGGVTSLVYVAGEFSHAVRRSSSLRASDQGAGSATRADRRIELVEPTLADLDLGRCVLDAVPLSCDLLYAQVDAVPSNDGTPLLLETELTTPQLFLTAAPDAAVRLAMAIAEWATAHQRAFPTSISD